MLVVSKSKIETSSQKSVKRSRPTNVAGLWRRFSLVVNPADISPSAALLETATGGCAAIEPIDRTHARVSVHVPRSGATYCAVKIRQQLSAARRYHVLSDAVLQESDVQDKAWASSWKRYYRPFALVPGLFIVPSWARRFKKSGRARVLQLDPGMAFGTGQHPTTRLAAQMLVRRLKCHDTVIDVGCGSGILALVAAMQGGRVYANDSDSVAVAATKENFARNKLKAASIRRARGVPAVFPKADIITANITARVLSPLAKQLACKLKAGGVVISSGVVDSGRQAVLDAFRRSGLTLIEERRDGEWFAHLHRKGHR